jgi:hypothetical protein
MAVMTVSYCDHFYETGVIEIPIKIGVLTVNAGNENGLLWE